MADRPVIIGGGAAGLTAAAFSHHALVLERLPEPGRKILVTGGGRCNILHEGTPSEIAEAFAPHARFVRPALSAFPPVAQATWFASLGVPTHTEPGGFLFPDSGRAEDVRTALLRAARAAGATIRTGAEVRTILVRENGSARAVEGVELASGERIEASRVILAAGGAARPGLGTDGAAARLAGTARIPCTPLVPAIGALRVEAPLPLAGLTLPDAALRIGTTSTRGALLFTDKGLSGPAALNLCAEASLALDASPTTLRVSWDATRAVPERWTTRFSAWRTAHGAALVRNLLARELPRSLAFALFPGECTAARLPRTEALALAERCASYPFRLLATDDFSACMATRGGIACSALSSKTLETHAVHGLFVCGEACEPVGACGGYNLSWAWASGRLAALA